MGHPAYFPRDVEAVLFRFVAACRHHDVPMYKSSIITHGQRLLDGTMAALGFVRVVDGKYESDEDGHLVWDAKKWDNWFYRRFWGDRRDDGAGMGKQHLLDIHRGIHADARTLDLQRVG